MLAGCDWWISNRFRRRFVFQSRVSKKTVVISLSRNGQAQRRSEILMHTSNWLLRNNSEKWTPRSSDKSFSTLNTFLPGSWSKFSVGMCWNLSPFCTFNKHSQSRQQSPELDEFFCSRTTASFLGVPFVDNIEEWPPMAKFARQQHLIIRKHKPQTPTKNLQSSVHVPAKH